MPTTSDWIKLNHAWARRTIHQAGEFTTHPIVDLIDTIAEALGHVRPGWDVERISETADRLAFAIAASPDRMKLHSYLRQEGETCSFQLDAEELGHATALAREGALAVTRHRLCGAPCRHYHA